jgi:pilus assembly protein TadC
MLWVLMAILALVRLQFLWLPLVGTFDRIPLESGSNTKSTLCIYARFNACH